MWHIIASYDWLVDRVDEFGIVEIFVACEKTNGVGLYVYWVVLVSKGYA